MIKDQLKALVNPKAQRKDSFFNSPQFPNKTCNFPQDKKHAANTSEVKNGDLVKNRIRKSMEMLEYFKKQDETKVKKEPKKYQLQRRVSEQVDGY